MTLLFTNLCQTYFICNKSKTSYIHLNCLPCKVVKGTTMCTYHYLLLLQNDAMGFVHSVVNVFTEKKKPCQKCFIVINSLNYCHLRTLKIRSNYFFITNYIIHYRISRVGLNILRVLLSSSALMLPETII